MSESEIEMIADAAAAWCNERSPLNTKGATSIPDAAEDARGHWDEMIALGWPAALISAEFGGVEIGFAALARIMEAQGRNLIRSPLISSGVFAAILLKHGASAEQQAALLPLLAAGEVFVVAGATTGHERGHGQFQATASGAGWVLTGSEDLVVDGMAADHFLVSASIDADRSAVFVVPAGLVRRERSQLADGSIVANLVIENVQVDPAARLDPDLYGPALAAALAASRVMIAAEALGSAGRIFEIICEYLKTRRQFGRVIGSFQALQHRAAKMYIQLELAKSCLVAAVAVLEAGKDAARLTALAAYMTKSTVHLVSNEGIQMHGGVGMTDVNPVGFFLKRARVQEALYGNAGYHLAKYADSRGL